MKAVSLPMPPETLPRKMRFAALQRLGKLLLGSPLNAALTLVFSALLIVTVPPMLRWLVIDAVWFNPDPNACRTATGACWSFVYAKSGQLLFGIYPVDER